MCRVMAGAAAATVATGGPGARGPLRIPHLTGLSLMRSQPHVSPHSPGSLETGSNWVHHRCSQLGSQCEQHPHSTLRWDEGSADADQGLNLQRGDVWQGTRAELAWGKMSKSLALASLLFWRRSVIQTLYFITCTNNMHEFCWHLTDGSLYARQGFFSPLGLRQIALKYNLY